MRVEKLENRFSTDQLMTGIQIREFIKIMHKNKWGVSPQYLHRAAWLGGWSIPATVLGKIEDAIYAKRLNDMEIDPQPLIILGHWRSGTTHLQSCLMRDPANTAPTVWQVVFPQSFLLTGRVGPKLLAGLLDDTRSYDNMAQSWHEPAEDEIALAKMTGLSLYVGHMFPDTCAQYEKYLDFLEVSPEEKLQWKKAMTYFVKKIMMATDNKRVLVKSCPHTARIRMLNEVFPNAKYIHIHRNPYRTFRSTLHMRGKVDWENFMQVPDQSYIDQRWEHTATIGEKLFSRFIEDKKLIAPENYFEMSYNDFIGNQAQMLQSAYEHLSIGGWDHFETKLTPYLDSLKDYKKNELDMPQDLRDFIYDRWRIVFDYYGYDRECGE